MGFISTARATIWSCRCFRPLTGHGFHPDVHEDVADAFRFRPLTGHGFHLEVGVLRLGVFRVSVPLRGMGFIGKNAYAYFNIKTHC